MNRRKLDTERLLETQEPLSQNFFSSWVYFILLSLEENGGQYQQLPDLYPLWLGFLSPNPKFQEKELIGLAGVRCSPLHQSAMANQL